MLSASACAVLSLLAASPEDSLVGRWGVVEGKPLVLFDLPPNGLAQAVVSAGIWSADGRELRLVDPARPDKPYVVPYSFEDGKLKVVLDGQPSTLERLEAPPEYRRPKDKKSPEILSHGFVKADSEVYSVSRQDGGFLAIGSSAWVHFDGAQAASFQVLAPGVGKDAKGVYCLDDDDSRKKKPIRLHGADPKTFRVLHDTSGRTYFTDSKDVFTECRRLVKRERVGPQRLASFDSKSFALGPCGLLRDKTGAYGVVPYPDAFTDRSRLDEVLRLQDRVASSQLWVHERVSGDVDTLAQKGCDKLPEPSPLTEADLPSPKR